MNLEKSCHVFLLYALFVDMTYHLHCNIPVNVLLELQKLHHTIKYTYGIPVSIKP